MRIFLDANILFSAARTKSGAVAELIDWLLAEAHELVASDYVLLEARRNLELQHEARALAAFDAFARRIVVVAQPAPRSGMSALERLPEKDRPVLAAAISSRSAVLLTGDRRHFGPFFGKRLAGVLVHSPASLAAELLEDR